MDDTNKEKNIKCWACLSDFDETAVVRQGSENRHQYAITDDAGNILLECCTSCCSEMTKRQSELNEQSSSSNSVKNA